MLMQENVLPQLFYLKHPLGSNRFYILNLQLLFQANALGFQYVHKIPRGLQYNDVHLNILIIRHILNSYHLDLLF